MEDKTEESTEVSGEEEFKTCIYFSNVDEISIFKFKEKVMW